MSEVNNYLGEVDKKDETDEADKVDAVEESDEFEQSDFDGEATLSTSNVGETSVEINVQDLIAELESDMPQRPESAEKPARKKLEEILEERRAAREFGEDDELDLTC